MDVRKMSIVHSINVESKTEFPLATKRKRGVVLNSVDFHSHPGWLAVAGDDAIVRL